MRIRTRLLLLGLSILIPAFLASAIAIWFVYSEQRQSQEQSLSEAAKGFALLVDKNMQAIEGQLQALARSPELVHDNVDGFALHARAVSPTPDRVIVLSAPDGQQLLNTRAAPGAQLPSSNASLQALRDQTPMDTVVSDMFIGRVAKRKDVAVDVPVIIEGRARYRLSMGLSVSELQRLIVEQGFPDGWIATIVDRNGVILARNADPAKFVGGRATDAMMQRIQAREAQGINVGHSLDGRAVVAFFYRAPVSGWTAILAIPQSELRRPAVVAAVFLTAILALLLLLAVFVAGYLARQTVMPIEQLRSAAALLGEGETVTLTRTGLAEVDLVGDALTSASSLVRAHHDILQQRVAEAVAASELAQRALLQAQKLEALGRLTGGVAHDFNNILQTLSSCFQLMRLTPDRTRVDALIVTGEKAIGRATALTAQLRSFGRVQDVRLETVDLAEALQAISPLLVGSLPGNIVLDRDLPAGLWPATIDRLQFELAVLNVIINARDAMPRGGQILLSLRNTTLHEREGNIGPGDYVVLAIADQGTGMPAEVQAKALDPFFTTKPVNQGSGLGLPQAYGFATQARGGLTLSSAEGKGTTVTIYLPRATAVAELPTVARASGLEGGSGRILFVDDDNLVRETVGPALEHAGFSVVAAHSGDAALALLEGGIKVDVLFSDVIMPGKLNGIELARVVLARFPGIQVVLASGHTDVAIDLSNVKLIGKPYEIGSLINLLDSAAPSSQG